MCSYILVDVTFSSFKDDISYEGGRINHGGRKNW